jgi:murein DD-endopeptidase MepM/ murein hydrolase activator NlpD
MNPNGDWSPVTVEVFGDGGVSRRNEFMLGPYTRHTIDLNAESAGMGTTWVKVSSSSGVVAERPSYFTYEPKAVSGPVTFATWNGVELKSPIRYTDLLGCVFHQASAQNSDGRSSGAQVLQPVGQCMRDDNPGSRYRGISIDTGGDPAYFIEESRGRGTFSTTACDVQSKAGADVLAPVDGTVLAAESYLLYGKYPDLRVYIIMDGQPGYHVAVLHMSSLAVSKGQRVEAGKTVIGTVRNLVPYFNSGPNDYTREEGNHAHVQIDYQPDMHL